MAEIICDTSFLVHIANNRIKNISTLDTDIGSIQFVVPDTVVAELEQLLQNPAKREAAISTLNYIKRFKIMQMGGTFADSQFISFVKKHGGIIATMDKELKQQIKKIGGSVLSISNNKIILE